MADEILCPRCTAANPKGTGFCGKCGASLAATMVQEAQPDPLIGAFIGERFLVKRKLGEGGMGVVYEAEQTAIDRKVALKVLHPHLTDESLYARFRNEAAASSRLGHPNTITVFDFGKTDTGSLYIAMEFIEGASLDDEIRRCGALDWKRAARIVAQICGSLQNAHENGIVHRDLKPENVMLLTRGAEKDVVKVLDFGIAKIMEDDGKDQRQALTKTGMVFGTPQYMSPEQIRGEKVDARSDIYSVGVIVYQMLTGALPFQAETPMGLLTKHLMDAPPPFEKTNPAVQVPAEMQAIVLKSLAKTAAERPQSMREILEAMEALLAAHPSGTVAAPAVGAVAKTMPMGAEASGAVVAAASGASPRVAPAKKSKTGLIVGIIVGGVLLLGGGGTAAWWFTIGPGGAPAIPRIVTPPIGPQVPPIGPATPPDNGQAVAQQGTGPVAPLPNLPAIPTDTDPGAGGTKPNAAGGGGGGGGHKVPKEKATPCQYNAGDDDVARAIRDQLRPKEKEIRYCALAVNGAATARFTFSVAANGTSLSGLRSSSSTGMEGCLRTPLNVSLPSSSPDARTGEITVLMEGQAGKDKCSVTVTAKVKAQPPTTTKPGDDDKKDGAKKPPGGLIKLPGTKKKPQ